MSDKYNAVCRRAYMPAAHTSGRRDVSAIKLIVLHDTEGGTSESIARYFQSPASGGSAHIVVDDGACYRCLPDDAIPWGAPGANSQGFHIEQCGYASWSKARWLLHWTMLRRAAYKIAVHAAKFDIPIRYVTAEMLRADANTPGVTTHLQVTLSGIGGPTGTHTDPGSGYPLGAVLWLAKRYHKRMVGK